MQWSTCQEERPPALLLADLAESFKIPHLANWSSPLSEKPLVQAPAYSVGIISQQSVAEILPFDPLPVSIGGGHASKATVSPATAAK
jgi:hypothetical protein